MKQLTIRINANKTFEDKTHTYYVDAEKTVSAVIAKEKDTQKFEVHSYLFEGWEETNAKEWVKAQKKSPVAHLLENKTTVGGKMTLCASLPKLSAGCAVEKLTKSVEAQLNDKYFFYTEGVHEGTNLNGAHFYRDELVKSYKSASHQPIDWEHRQDEIIGHSMEAELVDRPEEPLALAFNGVLNRMVPYMQMEERVDDELITRDELIKQRFYEDALAVSMEAMFDSIRCTECEQEFDSFIEFDVHKMTMHRSIIEAGEVIGMGLIGIAFVGWGIVKNPGDPEAYATHLRTGEDGTLLDIETASLNPIDSYDTSKMVFASEEKPEEETITVPVKIECNVTIDEETAAEKFQREASEVAALVTKKMKEEEASKSAEVKIGDKVEEDAKEDTKGDENKEIENHLKQISVEERAELEAFRKENTKIDEEKAKELVKQPIISEQKTEKDDNNSSTINDNNLGGNIMFDLAKKVADVLSLSDLFVKAQTVLRDYQGDKVLGDEETAAFASELAEVVKAFIEKPDFKVSETYTLTDAQKLEAIESARDEEKAIATSEKEESDKAISTLEAEKTSMSAQLDEATTKIKDLEEAEANKLTEAKIDKYMESFNTEGIELTPLMTATFRTVVAGKMGTENEEDEIKELKKELKASMKQEELVGGSKTLGANTSGGDSDEGGTLGSKLEKIQNKFKNRK